MKAHFFLFNIEGYGEFFSGITPSSGTLKIARSESQIFYFEQ